MKWQAVDLNNIRVIGPKPRGGYDIRYGCDGDPFRFQLPVGITENGINEFSSMILNIDGNPDFFEWFSALEMRVGRLEPWESNIIGTCIRLKITEDTQFFEEGKFTFEAGDIKNSEVRAIMEITGKYGPFNEKYGLTCKVYQLSFKRLSGTYLFSDTTNFEDFS